jgi:hypothetical protein
MTFQDYIKQVAIKQGSLVDLVPAQTKPSIYYYIVNNEAYMSKIYEGIIENNPKEIKILEFHDIWLSEQGYVNDIEDRTEFPEEFDVDNENHYAYLVPDNIVATVKESFPEILL